MVSSSTSGEIIQSRSGTFVNRLKSAATSYFGAATVAVFGEANVSAVRAGVRAAQGAYVARSQENPELGEGVTAQENLEYDCTVVSVRSEPSMRSDPNTFSCGAPSSGGHPSPTMLTPRPIPPPKGESQRFVPIANPMSPIAPPSVEPPPPPVAAPAPAAPARAASVRPPQFDYSSLEPLPPSREFLFRIDTGVLEDPESGECFYHIQFDEKYASATRLIAAYVMKKEDGTLVTKKDGTLVRYGIITSDLIPMGEPFAKTEGLRAAKGIPLT